MRSSRLLLSLVCVALLAGTIVAGRPYSASAQSARRIEIRPGQTIQAIVDAAPPRSVFVLKAGVHRLQSIEPRAGDTFTGEPGAILSGARLLTFRQSGSYWIATGQTQQGAREGHCKPGVPRCTFPEDLFVDDERREHVGSLSAVRPGTWFFDYAADTIYLAENPAGRRVEASVTPAAFIATGQVVTGVTIADLVIEKYANAGNTGAIWAPNSVGWTIEGNEIRWNHAAGLMCGARMQVRNNQFHHNGQVGLGGYQAADVRIEGNEITGNNTAGFDPYWGAGGVKIVGASGVVMRGNRVERNGGPGMWCDFDCQNALFEQNTVQDNEQAGIFYEVSFGAVIRNNTISRNGFGVADGPAQAGIFVAASKDVVIHGNTLVDNASGIVAFQEDRGRSPLRGTPFAVENLDVYDNTITLKQGITGLIQRVRDRSFYTSRNNRFHRNRYNVADAVRFVWMDAPRSRAEWQQFGQDQTGTFSR